MLIRSQDKTFLLNFNNLTAIYMEKIDKDFAIVYNDFEDAYTLGKYSTREKAMKVLDMIQEAYGDSEYTKYVIPEVCRILSIKPKTEENKAHAGELGEMLKKGMTFQMPEDSEVEA